jgi:hypothetical protein
LGSAVTKFRIAKSRGFDFARAWVLHCASHRHHALHARAGRGGRSFKTVARGIIAPSRGSGLPRRRSRAPFKLSY